MGKVGMSLSSKQAGIRISKRINKYLSAELRAHKKWWENRQFAWGFKLAAVF